MANKRVCQGILENLGGDSGTIPAVSSYPVQWRRSSDSWGYEMCLPDITDGNILDDRGIATSNHIHDSYGRYWVVQYIPTQFSPLIQYEKKFTN